MNEPNVLVVARELPAKGLVHDGYKEARGDEYGRQLVVPKSRYELARNGPYFVMKNATPGTAVLGHAAATTFDQTKPYILMYNGSDPAAGVCAYIDYLKLMTVAVGTSSTDQHFNVVTEAANRHSSAGTDYSAKAGQAVGYTSAHPLINSSSVFSVIRVGATVATAAGATARTLVNEQLRSSIPVAFDRWLFKFGGNADVPPTDHGYLVTTATIVDGVFQCAPIVVPPGYSVLFHLWAAACAAAPSFEFELGWWEE